MGDLKIVVGQEGAHKRTLVDRGSGVAVEFHYRLPTNQERIAYQQAAVRRTRKRVVVRPEAAALEHVVPLLEGFRFPYQDEDPDSTIRWENPQGQLVVLSCRASEPGYREDWRDILRQAVPHMLATLGLGIFGGVVEDSPTELEVRADFDLHAGDDGGDDLPNS